MSTSYKQLPSSPNVELIFLLEEEVELLSFLYEVLAHRSRNSVKSMLTRGQIVVDHRVETQFNYVIRKGQKVVITKNEAAKRRSLLQGVSIVHEDKDLLVIEKEAGLLSIATEKESEMTAYHQLLTYERSKNSRNRIFIVHRLDRDTSGLMIFAKNQEVQRILQNAWHKLVNKRVYVALVEGEVCKPKGTISSWLKETKAHIVYSSPKKKDALHAITHYRVMQNNQDYSLLEVRLETGRKNQIRVHMQDIGHPVVGDEKYGSKINPIGRLGLHANLLGFTHPITNKKMHFTSDPPQSFHEQTKEK